VIKQETQRKPNSKRKPKISKKKKMPEKMTSKIKWNGAQIFEFPYNNFHSIR
jgi:hypothetical protein